MYLFLSIVLATILGYLLFVMEPFIGGIIAFGIVLGCLFRGLYLLNDISNRLSKIAPKPVKIKDALERYLEEKKNINEG